jgi:MATE family multidrug resistance protein
MIPEINVAIFCIDRRALDWEGIKSYLAISVPSVIMLCLDWWAFEVMILISGLFGVTQQAALIIIMNIAVIFFRISMGFEQAASTLIGKSIGMGSLHDAKHYYKLLRIISTVTLSGLIFILYVYHKPIIGYYTNDEQIQENCYILVYVMFFTTFPENFTAMLRGVIRALAMQQRSVYVTLTGHWIINFTSIYIICFYFNMGIAGIWWSKLVFESFISAVYLIMIKCKDW